MRLFISFILLINIWFDAHGQLSPDDSDLLTNAIREVTKNEQVTLIKNVPGGCWDRLQSIVEKGKIKGHNKINKSNSILLSKLEINGLLDQIKICRKFIWDDSVFPAFNKIQVDSMWIFLDRENKKHFKKLNEVAATSDTNYLNKMKSWNQWVFTITKPIYFRNNSFSLLFLQAMCGNPCGRNEIALYKKENCIWQKWIIIESGDY